MLMTRTSCPYTLEDLDNYEKREQKKKESPVDDEQENLEKDKDAKEENNPLKKTALIEFNKMMKEKFGTKVHVVCS